jgi:hypothetical protein
MELLKDIWNVLVILFAMAYFGVLGTATYQLGMSALSLHEKGLFSLSKFNQQLVGSEGLSK